MNLRGDGKNWKRPLSTPGKIASNRTVLASVLAALVLCPRDMIHQPKRIAMWSGPRNISTAMMRAWGNRPDCFVTDEPLYAHYLNETHLPHPGAEEVIANGETDWRKVVAYITGPIPECKS